MSDSETPLEPSDVLVVPAVVAPDRADAPVSEVTERFLRAVIASVPLERIEELHLFAPLRQGGVETGIAVIAARVPSVAPLMAPVDDTLVSGEDAIDEPAAAMPEDDVVQAVDDAIESVGESASESAEDNASADAIESDSPYLDEAMDEDGSMAAGVSDSLHPMTSDATSTPSDREPPATPLVRHTVYTARYRLVLKGPDRGKWEADVVDEADAPLITVEMVVRGVQRRAGEETEILRYSDRQIARALRMSWPQPGLHGHETLTPIVG